MDRRVACMTTHAISEVRDVRKARDRGALHDAIGDDT
jgi:hypothetical protein